MAEVTFINPDFLWFLLAIPILIIADMLTLKLKKARALKFANFEALTRAAPHFLFASPFVGLMRSGQILILLLRTLTLLTLIFALSGTIVGYNAEVSDFDYVLALDTSSSMIIDDFSPNRLEAAKQASTAFIDELKEANVGIVTFSGVTLVDLRPTPRKDHLQLVLSNLSISRIGGTDIGGALITAANLLEGSEKEKSIILLTDGRANLGTPIAQALDYVLERNIVVHTIGLATDQGGSLEGIDNVRLTLDEETLQSIASASGGTYLRARDPAQLTQEFTSLASAQTKLVRKNLTLLLIFLGLGLLLFEWTLVNVKYRTVP